MKALLPHQPITTDGKLPSRALLEILQIAARATTGNSDGIDTLSGQVASILTAVTDLETDVAGKADAVHTHTSGEITDATSAGVAMLTAADAAAQTALLDDFTSTEKGLAPASGGGSVKVLRADGWVEPCHYGVLAADYTLASTTATQRLFNWSASGALTVATGVYRFKCGLYLTGMNAASGNAAFNLLGAGTATLARVFYNVVGVDSSTPLDATNTRSSASVTSASAASMVVAATGTGLVVQIDGVFDATAAGTIIPSIALVTAAAATVKAGSFFTCERIGATGAAASAGWS